MRGFRKYSEALTAATTLLFISSALFAQGPGTLSGPLLSAEAIMARVALNQDRADAARSRFVYLQHARIQSRKGGTVMCEEISEERVAPTADGNQRSSVSFSGHVRDGNRSIHYTEPAHKGAVPNGKEEDGATVSVDNDKEIVLDADAGNRPVTVSDTDIDIVQSLRRTFTSDKRDKDGIYAGLFPLTTAQQKDMLFTLKGRELKNGHDTFHILFRPKDNDDVAWKGEAWIDTTVFQPVVIRTALSRALPLGVRMLLGTNVPGLGFTVIYAPQAEGVWFPVSFGTEFKLHVLFLFERHLTASVDNRDFEETHVNATIHADAAQPIDPTPKN